MAHDYDLTVIGGGAAGLTAAGMSALLGARTLLVEANRLGGECTWTGCVPSKTLLHAARSVHQARNSLYLPPSDAPVDFARVMQTVHQTREHIYRDADAPPNLESLGVAIAFGTAAFQDSHTIEIVGPDGARKRVSSRFFVIATGSRPHIPEFDAPVLTNESVFDLSSLPARLAVVGGGPEGIELAQAFRRLGSQVTVIANAANILPKDDPELTRILLGLLRREGIAFELERRATHAQTAGSQIDVTLDDGRRLSCDAVLAAAGRRPNIESLQLPAAGVGFDGHGVSIDRYCRTSAPHIYASGDVTGKHQFTHMAEHMSKVAVTNAILRVPRSVDTRHVVWCTYTDPELAHLGASEEDLKQKNTSYDVYRFPFHKLDRAITEANTEGLIKVLAGRRGRILGVSILGVHAGEMISEWALAMRHRLKVGHIASTIHPYPTYLLGNRRAADQRYRRSLSSPLLGLLGRVLGYRGVRRPPGLL